MGDVPSLARAYAEHLLDGGTTPWPDFLGGGALHEEGAASSWTGEPPGAAQAELLRRLNRRRDPRPGGAPGPGDAEPRAWREHVLRRAAPGRGQVDLLLCDPPEPVPVHELLRVGSAVLADLVAGLPLAPPDEDPPPDRGRAAPPTRSPVWSRRGPAYRLEGPPLAVADLRRRLASAGLPPHESRRWRLRRRPDVVLVLALPVPAGLADVWAHRVQHGATKTWQGLLAEWHTRRRVPPGVAYDRLASAWAARVGARRVHVLTGADLDEQVAEVLGRRPAQVAAGLPALLPPAVAEVVRLASEVLTFRVPPEEKPRRLDLLVTLLAEPAVDRDGGADRVPLPPRQERWVVRAARRSARRLRAGEYVVHGSLSPRTLRGAEKAARPARSWDRAVLGALLEAVLTAQAVEGGTR